MKIEDVYYFRPHFCSLGTQLCKMGEVGPEGACNLEIACISEILTYIPKCVDGQKVI